MVKWMAIMNTCTKGHRLDLGVVGLFSNSKKLFWFYGSKSNRS